MLESAGWPFDGLRITTPTLTMRPVRDADLDALAAVFPDDAEQDPRSELIEGLSAHAQRIRLLRQGIWRNRGLWSPESWILDLSVLSAGEAVGIQTLEADGFARLRTVDTGSWLATSHRGRGIGIAMRTAVLALAFEHLGAVAAVTSAGSGNAASLGVSRHLGYRPNGVSLNDSGDRVVELTHLRLTRSEWPGVGEVQVTGLAPCLPYFGIS
ncbi:GNAT family N-acetyltransferase [Rudaeicoccus suwonensis]|uniref:RimJ/RimL family protein N-acetyltransferase n=1 Tax=Rudaeicoccus suwonensis TaxID=657409 RepID=A0A561E3P5_9MICO|nr:GNAT family protein [Rudaeicoccus suwonensis]TWE10220.1 RimJ/RimL family protein N-acetyltransferase [Rudaeicoccus suwonensis]